MNKVFEGFNLKRPLHSLLPWDGMDDFDNLEFRNLHHFINVVSKLKQKEDYKCGISYDAALNRLTKGISDFPKEEQKDIQDLVRSKLHKRGLITAEVYEHYKYAAEGTGIGVDIGKYAAGEPDCVITPTRQYIDFFYELFISISYPYDISDKTVAHNTAKLLAAVKELERQHIFIKITLVFPARRVSSSGNDLFSSIPLFSHKDPKDVDRMSSVVNERLLRKFYFAILEGMYGDDLVTGYGTSMQLEGVMNIGDTFDAVAFFEGVQKSVGAV